MNYGQFLYMFPECALVLALIIVFAFDFAMNGVEETAANSLFFAAHPGDGAGYVALCCFVDLLTGHSWAHMWYLYMLLGLYLLLPFMRKVVAGSSAKELWGLAGILFFFAGVVPLLGLFGMEADYRFSYYSPLYGWSVKAAVGADFGKTYGKNLGFQLTIAKTGTLLKGKKVKR